MTAPSICWFSGPRVALPLQQAGRLRCGFRDEDAHFRVRRLQIRRQASAGSTLQMWSDRSTR